jgi:hypothetical protein
VLHVSFHNPQFFCSSMLLVVLGSLRYCIVLVLFKYILTFACLNIFVILRNSGLYYVDVVQCFVCRCCFFSVVVVVSVL